MRAKPLEPHHGSPPGAGLPNALIALGALVGATLGWFFGAGSLGFQLGAHVAVVVGFALMPSRRRGAAALVGLAIIWWPAWIGQFFWD